MTNRIPSPFTRTLMAWVTLCLIHGTSAAAPPSSFELDPKELETVAPATRQPRRSPSRPARKPADRGAEKPRPTAAPDDDEGISRYTVKPGDFLFKILIREYGLSNAAAEALVPEIARINRLASTTRLEVGQTILIPIGRRKGAPPRVVPAPSLPATAASPAEPPPAPPAPAEPPQPPADVVTSTPAEESRTPRPEEAAAQAPAPPAVVASVEPPPALPAETPFAETLLKLWEELVPGQEKVEPVTLNAKVLSPSDYPLLLAADGGKILVDLRGTLPSQARGQLTQKYPDIRVVTRGKETLRQFFTTLLRTAEFARIDENFPVELGAVPKLTVRADFRIVRLPAASRGPETVLLFVDEEGPCIPLPLRDYLTRKGYQVAEFCQSSPSPSFAEPGYDLRSLPSSTPCEMSQSLLEALSIRLDRNRIVSGSMGSGAENRFSIRVEGYFEANGKRFILNCSESDSYNYTLFRLLQLQGYGIIEARENDDFATVAERLLSELKYPHAFGRFDLDYGRYKVAVIGFKVARKGNSTGRLFLTNIPADPVFAELLRWAPKK